MGYYATNNQLIAAMAIPALFTAMMVYKMGTCPFEKTGVYYLLACGGTIITCFSPVLLDALGIARLFP